MILQFLSVNFMELFVKSEFLESIKDIRTSDLKDRDKLIEGLRLFIFKVPFHFLMVAKNAVIICRLIEIFNDFLIKFFDIDFFIAIEISLNIFDDLQKYAPS